MVFDPRGFEKAMKRTVCPHFAAEPVCGVCAHKMSEGWEFHGRVECADGTVRDRYRRPFGGSFEFSEVIVEQSAPASGTQQFSD
jgi:hypothetical protein